MVRKASFLGKWFSKSKEGDKEQKKAKTSDRRGVGGKVTKSASAGAVKTQVTTKVRVKTAGTPKNRIDQTRKTSGNGGGDVRERATLEAEIKARPKVQPVAQPARTLRKKEDAQKAIVNGFQDLSQLLNGIKDKMSRQGEQNDQLISKFDDLPEAAKAQITFLQKISTQMADQQTQASQLLEKFGQVPELLSGVKEILAAQQKADERRDQTLGRFRETMDRINAGISTMSRENKTSMEQTAQTIKQTQGEAVDKLERSQGDILKTFQAAHEKQTKAMTEAMAGSARQNRMVLAFLGAAILIMATIFVLFLTGQLG